MKANKANKVETDKNGNGQLANLANQNQAQIASNNLQDFDLFYMFFILFNLPSCLLHALCLPKGGGGLIIVKSAAHFTTAREFPSEFSFSSSIH